MTMLQNQNLQCDSYNIATETRTMTPLRTQNEIIMVVLPALDRQAPLD
jgi:hypothetical protein